MITLRSSIRRTDRVNEEIDEASSQESEPSKGTLSTGRKGSRALEAIGKTLGASFDSARGSGACAVTSPTVFHL